MLLWMIHNAVKWAAGESENLNVSMHTNWIRKELCNISKKLLNFLFSFRFEHILIEIILKMVIFQLLSRSGWEFQVETSEFERKIKLLPHSEIKFQDSNVLPNQNWCNEKLSLHFSYETGSWNSMSSTWTTHINHSSSKRWERVNTWRLHLMSHS